MTRIIAALALVLMGPLAQLGAQGQPQKRFMGGPVTIEDQGSFFVGGVTKVSEHAALPFAPLGFDSANQRMSGKRLCDFGRPFAPGFDRRMSYFRQLTNHGVGLTAISHAIYQ